MKKYQAVVVSWMLTIWSIWFPTDAHALTAATKVKCEDPSAKWNKKLSKAYAYSLMTKEYGWNKTEYKALIKLWGKESAWNHTADNPNSTAYGIPQILGLKVGTPAPQQIERGLAYIKHRYEKPSIAWAHWRIKGWY